MYKKKLNDGIICPLEYGLSVFGSKWKPRVLCMLEQHGVLRYKELHREILMINDATLAATLRELLADGLVMRTSYDEIPPRVDYRLTEKGRAVLPILHAICDWAEKYQNDSAGRSVQMDRCKREGFQSRRECSAQ